MAQASNFLKKNGPILGAVAVGCGCAYYFYHQRSTQGKVSGTSPKVPSKMADSAADTVSEVQKAIEKVSLPSATGTEGK
jgi:hypothetical protein